MFSLPWQLMSGLLIARDCCHRDCLLLPPEFLLIRPILSTAGSSMGPAFRDIPLLASLFQIGMIQFVGEHCSPVSHRMIFSVSIEG
jgi:hypothetical protein